MFFSSQKILFTVWYICYLGIFFLLVINYSLCVMDTPLVNFICADIFLFGVSFSISAPPSAGRLRPRSCPAPEGRAWGEAAARLVGCFRAAVPPVLSVPLLSARELDQPLGSRPGAEAGLGAGNRASLSDFGDWLLCYLTFGSFDFFFFFFFFDL